MMNKLSIFTILIFLVMTVFVSGCVALDNSAMAAAPGECTVQGAWVGNFAGGPWDTPLIFQNTVTPQDPAGKKLTYVMRWVNPDATLRIPDFEETDYTSDLVGEAIKTGPMTMTTV